MSITISFVGYKTLKEKKCIIIVNDNNSSKVLVHVHATTGVLIICIIIKKLAGFEWTCQVTQYDICSYLVYL